MEKAIIFIPKDRPSTLTIENSLKTHLRDLNYSAELGVRSAIHRAKIYARWRQRQRQLREERNSMNLSAARRASISGAPQKATAPAPTTL